MSAIKSSELITNDDGSIFHLHLLPEDLADDVILVGDPGRVEMITKDFDIIEVKRSNREFYSVTGLYNKHRFTVLSTGIGPDNIDIVMNELDALVNIDLNTKEIKPLKKSLNIVRIGTSGSLQAEVPVHGYVISEVSIGIDGVIRFYGGNEEVCDNEMEDAFFTHCDWIKNAARPYAVKASKELVRKLYNPTTTFKGITLTAHGFYGPQGRILRLPLAMSGINDRIATFEYEDYKVINYEMESAAITGLANMLGHKATSICLIIANRATGDASPDYKSHMEDLVKYTLNCLSNK